MALTIRNRLINNNNKSKKLQFCSCCDDLPNNRIRFYNRGRLGANAKYLKKKIPFVCVDTEEKLLENENELFVE